MFNFYIQRIKNIYHLLKAIIAVNYYGNPSRKIKVIGITGTDGKTTTTTLIYQILKKAGKKVSMISTVAAVIGEKKYDTGFHVTTPSPFDVQRYLQEAVVREDEYFILETTSHALDQYRVYGVQFEIGLITNITHEHMLYHQTYDHYVASKTRLLKWAHKALINVDDISYPLIIKKCTVPCITFGLTNKADYHLEIAQKLNLPLANFNRYNFLAAYAVCRELGIDEASIFTSMKTFTLPVGRMEVVYDSDFTVIVDFAHTPNAIHEALLSVRQQYEKRRLIHIFGAAAFRDDAKRPLMGEESARFADMSIITEEDYRTEDPEKIAREIGAGFEKGGFVFTDKSSFGLTPKTYTSVVHRKEAIEKALQIVKKGDVIILTGKGHEQSLCRGTVEHSWEDKREVLASIKDHDNQ